MGSERSVMRFDDNSARIRYDMYGHTDLDQISYICSGVSIHRWSLPEFDCLSTIVFLKLTKSGIPGWFLKKIGYLFFATGRAYARMQNASKTRSGA